MVDNPDNICVYIAVYYLVGERLKNNSNSGKCQERKSTRRHKKKKKACVALDSKERLL